MQRPLSYECQCPCHQDRAIMHVIGCCEPGCIIHGRVKNMSEHVWCKLLEAAVKLIVK